MLNWADLSSLTIIVAAAMGAIGGSSSENAGAMTSILFGVGGLIIGYIVAKASGRFAYSILFSNKLRDTTKFIVYLISPMLFLFATMAGSFLVAAFLIRLFN